jgi:hypothetical protein
MSENSRWVAASPEQVWTILSDGWSYPTWVVGASRISSVDKGWPAPGTRIDHSVGVWPLLAEDHTEVEESRPPEYLRLKARAWPSGEAVVEFLIEPEGAGSLVRIREQVKSGPAEYVPKAVVDSVLQWRNEETLNRLALLAERRSRPD